jgi:ribosomal protein S18 acetylase RimI-like enzyme
MTPTPKIRILAPHEWRIYKELRLRALGESPEAFGSTLAEALERSDADWSSRLVSDAFSGWDLPVVAEVDGEPIGLAWGHIKSSNPDVAYIFSVWVDPRYRQLGAGKKLVDAVIDWARSMNARYLDLGVLLADSPAMQLYTRSGFEPVGEPVPFRPGSEALGLNMRLDLKSSKAGK